MLRDRLLSISAYTPVSFDPHVVRHVSCTERIVRTARILHANRDTGCAAMARCRGNDLPGATELHRPG
jgi:hypothetical protein